MAPEGCPDVVIEEPESEAPKAETETNGESEEDDDKFKSTVISINVIILHSRSGQLLHKCLKSENSSARGSIIQVFIIEEVIFLIRSILYRMYFMI